MDELYQQHQTTTAETAMDVVATNANWKASSSGMHCVTVGTLTNLANQQSH